MKTWQIIQFGGGATMLAGFPFTFIFLMHIVPHIKCWIWIEHISQTTHWILMKLGQGMHNIMKNKYGKFQLNPMHGFRKMTIITYNHFAYILIFVHQINLSFGEQKNYGKRNRLTNFQENILHGFRENGRNHLQPICIFLKICDVGFSNFWCGDALKW